MSGPLVQVGNVSAGARVQQHVHHGELVVRRRADQWCPAAVRIDEVNIGAVLQQLGTNRGINEDARNPQRLSLQPLRCIPPCATHLEHAVHKAVARRDVQRRPRELARVVHGCAMVQQHSHDLVLALVARQRQQPRAGHHTKA